MPIKSMEQSYEFGAGLPCIARIRKGGPKTDPRRPGPDLSYFRVTMEPGFENHLSTFQILYGAEPTFFAPVRFGGTTVDEVFDYWNRSYTATKLMHKCDGETQVRHFVPETGESSTEPIACIAPECDCKNTGRVKLFMPGLIEETGIFGYVLLTTTSLYDIRNLLNCFRDMEHFAAMRGGDLSSIDFILGRTKRPITVPVPQPKTAAEKEKFRKTHDGRDWRPGDRMNTTKNLIYIRPTKDYTKRVLLAAVDTAKALPAGSEAVAHLVPNNKIVTTASAQRPPRRMGAPAQSVPEPTMADFDEQDDGDEPPPFLDEFLKWIKATFSEMREPQVNAALELAPEWGSGLDDAKAAIIAAAMGYDAKLISEYTGGHGYGIEVYDAALQIVARREQLADAETA